MISDLFHDFGVRLFFKAFDIKNKGLVTAIWWGLHLKREGYLRFSLFYPFRIVLYLLAIFSHLIFV